MSTYLEHVLLLSLFVLIRSIAASCVNPSNAFPHPHLYAGDGALSKLFYNLEYDLNESQSENQWNSNTTSFAIEITSAESTLWGTYHTASKRVSGNVTGDTYFRIASITKVFTVLAILLQQNEGKLSLQDSVSKYIPELTQGKNEGSIQWEDISLESLASQLSGIPRECKDVPHSRSSLIEHAQMVKTISLMISLLHRMGSKILRPSVCRP